MSILRTNLAPVQMFILMTTLEWQVWNLHLDSLFIEDGSKLRIFAPEIPKSWINDRLVSS